MNSIETEDAVEVIVSTAQPKRDVRPKRQPRYAVVVLNDDCHTFDYVIACLGRVCGYDRTRAYDLALTIHVSGRAAVWSGALEPAELKRDLIRGFGPDPYASKPTTFPLGVVLETID